MDQGVDHVHFASLLQISKKSQQCNSGANKRIDPHNICLDSDRECGDINSDSSCHNSDHFIGDNCNCVVFTGNSSLDDLAIDQSSQTPQRKSSSSMSISSGQLMNTFELQKELGDGAFGAVWLGKSRLDSQSYAIKMIPFFKGSDDQSDNNKEIDSSQEESFREVRTMAKMTSHPCVVRYYTAWLEEMAPDILEKVKHIQSMQADMTIMTNGIDQSRDSQSIPRISADVQMQTRMSLQSSVLCADGYNLSINYICDEDHFEYSEYSELDVGGKVINTIHHDTPNRVLIIQMEMCDNGTLRDLLRTRKLVDFNQSLTIFKQMVEALHHIHSYDVLHRDIKPENVFLNKKGGIKLGDFGLSISPSDRMRREFNNKINQSLNGIISEPNELTAGLGTPTYAAPEQLQSGRAYSKSADVYPLGLILYELLNIFSTDMERFTKLNELKNSFKMTENTTNEYPKLVHLITCMVSPEPEERPTTQDILDVLNVLELEKVQFHNDIYHRCFSSPTLQALPATDPDDDLPPSKFRRTTIINMLSPSTSRSTVEDVITNNPTELQKMLNQKNMQIELLRGHIHKLEQTILLQTL